MEGAHVVIAYYTPALVYALAAWASIIGAAS